MKDPYLKPGVACKITGYCIECRFYDTCGSEYKEPAGSCDDWAEIKKPVKDIPSEWPFAPDWAVYSTVDADGTIRFWDKVAPDIHDTEQWISGRTGYNGYEESTNFICPDKSRYESEAWKTSLRMRPKWAKIK